MTTKRANRRSTVQDYATLRLHLDGTRVELRSPQRSDLHHSRTRRAGRDARGNRVARDAAGLGVVPKRPAMLEDGHVETVSFGPDVAGDEPPSAEPRRSNRRKRRRLNYDVEFLRDTGNVPGSANAARETSWPVPSSDLLKCVNYFACQYYAARGLLLDRSRAYSREKEPRKAEDRQKVRTGDSGDCPFVEDGEDDGNVEREDCYESESTGHEGTGAYSEGLPDMYKALDGSALVAIGMLLQELVSTLLRPNVPPGWETEMEAAGQVPSDESIGPENECAEETQSDKSEDGEIWDESSSDDKD